MTSYTQFARSVPQVRKFSWFALLQRESMHAAEKNKAIIKIPVSWEFSQLKLANSLNETNSRRFIGNVYFFISRGNICTRFFKYFHIFVWWKSYSIATYPKESPGLCRNFLCISDLTCSVMWWRPFPPRCAYERRIR